MARAPPFWPTSLCLRAAALNGNLPTRASSPPNATHSVLVTKTECVAFGGDEARVGKFPFNAAARRQRLVGQNGGARAIGKQARADQNAGVVIHKKGGAANFDADGENFFGTPGGDDRFARAHIWQGRAAALADEVEGENIWAQT